MLNKPLSICGNHNTRRSENERRSPIFGHRRVHFAEELEKIHYVETNCESNYNEGESAKSSSLSAKTSLVLSEEISVLSSVHGRARRHLREIPKYCLESAVKYGTKTRGHPDPKTGLPRWKYTFGNLVYITDSTSTEEVTCYKESVKIAPAPISQEMVDRYSHVKRIIENEPHMCTSHLVVIVDQSGSMRLSDVNGFRNRSEAAYGCLALDCIAEQLTSQEEAEAPGIDTFTLIEMNDEATVVYDREPLDWILFNKMLERQSYAKPRSHGNYGQSIRAAETVINRELTRLEGMDDDELPAFAVILLSDGKPSDKDEYARTTRHLSVMSLSATLKDKFCFFGMGIGANGCDFKALEEMVNISKSYGGRGEFNHAGLSAASLGDGFSSLSSSMSTVRSALLSTVKEDHADDNITAVVPLNQRMSFSKSMDDCWKVRTGVKRYKFNLQEWKRDRRNENCVWYPVPMLAKGKPCGFAMDKVAFEKGSERRAYRFQEIDKNGKLIGKLLVAKETKGRIENEKKKYEFHEQFCRIQTTAAELASRFNRAVSITPLLRPLNTDDPTLPKISFVKCSVYGYTKIDGIPAGILVEHFLKGKFTKYNGNDGYVNVNEVKKSMVIEVQGGEVRMTDILHAFSHWSYVHSHQKLLLCDLQGVLNQEGRKPKFDLTDPAICSSRSKENKKRRYGFTDIGLKGIRNFFRTHKCNTICRCLGLPQ